MVREDPGWVMYLPVLVLAHNSKQHSSTGLTPMLAFRGREAQLPLGLIVELPQKGPSDLPGQVREMLDRYKKVYAYVQRKGESIIRRNSQQYAGQKRTFLAGDLCCYLSLRKVEGKSMKITNQWVGPVEVVEQQAEVLVAIRNPSSPRRVVVVHTNRLHPYQFGHTRGSIRPNELEDVDDFMGEEVTTEGAGPVSLNIPVHVPQHVPEMVDKGSALTRASDPKEPQPVVVDRTEVQEEFKPRRGLIRERSTSQEGRAPRSAKSIRPVEVKIGPGLGPEQPVTMAKLDRRGLTRPRETDTSDADHPPLKARLGEPGARETSIYPDSSTSGESSEGCVDKEGEVRVQLGPGTAVPSKPGREEAGYDFRAAETRTILGGQTQALSMDLVCKVTQYNLYYMLFFLTFK